MTQVLVQEQRFEVVLDGDAVVVAVATHVVRAVEVGVQGPQGPAGVQTAIYTAGQALSALRVVRADPATGRVVYADAGTSADAGLAMGLTTTSAANNAEVQVLTQGKLTDSGWTWDVSPGADRRLYLGSAGAVVQGAPSGVQFVQPVGVVTGATSVLVRVGPSVLG